MGQKSVFVQPGKRAARYVTSTESQKESVRDFTVCGMYHVGDALKKKEYYYIIN